MLQVPVGQSVFTRHWTQVEVAVSQMAVVPLHCALEKQPEVETVVHVLVVASHVSSGAQAGTHCGEAQPCRDATTPPMTSVATNRLDAFMCLRA